MANAKLDQLLRLFVKAKYELELLLSEMSDPIGTTEGVQLLNWIDSNKEAVTYLPYSHFAEAIVRFSQDPDSMDFKEYGNYGPLVRHFISVFDDFHAIDLFRLAYEVVDVPFNCNTSYEFFEKCERQYDAILRRIPGCDPGYVYILTNPSMPGLVKIGFTRRLPESRAAELNSTSQPTPFVVKYQQIVRNCEDIEAKVHHQLSGCRVSGNREFFRIEVDEAIRVINEVIRKQRCNMD